MSKANNKGRSAGSPHVRMDHSVFHSAAYRALDPTSRQMLLEIVGLYNGSNNGNIYLGVRDAALLLGVSDPKTASRALKRLIQHGLLAVTTPGAFTLKMRHATCYRITFLHTQGAGPTGEWRDFVATAGTPEAERLVALSECKLRSTFSTISDGKISTEPATDLKRVAASVEKIPTVATENRRFSITPSVENIPTQILCHSPRHEKAASNDLKKAAGLARQFIRREGVGSQGRLAARAGLSTSKLSRFLSNHSGKQGLTKAQAEALISACLHGIVSRDKEVA